MGAKTMTHRKYRRAWRPALDLTILSAALFAAGFALAADSTAADSTTTAPTQRAAASPASTLIVRVRLEPQAQGQVMLGLYDTARGYADERELIGQTVAIRNGQAEVPLEGLAPGRYAFKLFHDANGNGKLDTGAFGIPTERYFFSNDASDMFSAPEWEEASFRLSEGAFAYEVELD